jgi:hypothetical protein
MKSIALIFVTVAITLTVLHFIHTNTPSSLYTCQPDAYSYDVGYDYGDEVSFDGSI